MICKECGNKIAEGSNFCESCGAKMEEESFVFCPSCGQKNKGNSIYCGECGSKLKKDFNILSIFDGRYKNVKIIGTIVALVLIAIVMFVKSVSSPEATIKSFCSAVKKQDYKKMYDLLYLPESKFLTRDKFESYFDLDADSDIKSCKGERVRDTEPSVIKYIVTITNKDNQEAGIELTLSKKKNRKFLLFNNWGVHSEGMLVDEWEITVPKGSTLYIEGVKIDNKNSETSTIDEYIVNNLFKTSYKVKVTHPLSDDVIEEEESPNYSFRVDDDDFDIKDEIKNKSDEIKAIALKIYEMALINKDANSLNDILAPNHKIDIENLATSIKEDIDYYTSYGTPITEYKNINISSVRIYDSIIVDKDTVEFDLRSTIEYEYLLEGHEEFYSDTRTNYLTLLFKVKGNNLLLYGKN